MAIRMVDDNDRPQPGGGGGSGGNNNDHNRGGGGGKNPLIAFLPMIIMFLIKNPKLAIFTLILGGALYYFSGGGILQEEGGGQLLETGASLDTAKFGLAEVFEPLSYASSKNQRPVRASLLDYAPDRLNQGRQGSCVGWATSYAARTIQQARSTGRDPNSVTFSPSYLYNQIALTGCQGAYMTDALEVLKKGGSVPFSQFPYDVNTCNTKPSSSDFQTASQFKIKGYNRFSKGGYNYSLDMNGMKQTLAQGAPVVIGMMVGGSFMRSMFGREVWQPTQTDYSMRGYGGHAMCVIGYDDNKAGGAFQIMNSWGPQWGKNGVAWVRYSDFKHFTKESYGLYPMASVATQTKLDVKFGLVDKQTMRNINMRQVDNMTFRTQQPISISDSFKVEVTNTVECFTYIFGEDVDGSSYVLFPYTSRHSPYCGITGTRLFPKYQSMTPDNQGNRDRIAVVVTKEPIDYKVLNQMINQSRGRSYKEKLSNALGNQMIPNMKFQAGSTIDFSADTGGKNAVGIVIEIDKQ